MKPAVLTVVAVRPGVGRHGAVTREVLPLLDAHAHVGTRVLLAGRAWTCVKGGRQETAWEEGIAKGTCWALNTDRLMQNKSTTERETSRGRERCHQQKPDLDGRAQLPSVQGGHSTSSFVGTVVVFSLQVRRERKWIPPGLLWWHRQPASSGSRCVLADACVRLWSFTFTTSRCAPKFYQSKTLSAAFPPKPVRTRREDTETQDSRSKFKNARTGFKAFLFLKTYFS